MARKNYIVAAGLALAVGLSALFLSLKRTKKRRSSKSGSKTKKNESSTETMFENKFEEKPEIQLESLESSRSTMDGKSEVTSGKNQKSEDKNKASSAPRAVQDTDDRSVEAVFVTPQTSNTTISEVKSEKKTEKPQLSLVDTSAAQSSLPANPSIANDEPGSPVKAAAKPSPKKVAESSLLSFAKETSAQPAVVNDTQEEPIVFRDRAESTPNAKTTESTENLLLGGEKEKTLSKSLSRFNLTAAEFVPSRESLFSVGSAHPLVSVSTSNLRESQSISDLKDKNQKRSQRDSQNGRKRHRTTSGGKGGNSAHQSVHSLAEFIIEEKPKQRSKSPTREAVNPARAASKGKLNVTKCIFGPECHNKDKGCHYYHPTELCKFYPDCTYGTDCLYIHPKAKSTPTSPTRE